MRREKNVKKIPYSTIRLLEAIILLLYAVISYIYLKDYSQIVIGLGTIMILVFFGIILAPYPQRTVFQKCDRFWKTLFLVLVPVVIINFYLFTAPFWFAAYFLGIFMLARYHRLDEYKSKEELKARYADVMLP